MRIALVLLVALVFVNSAFAKKHTRPMSYADCEALNGEISNTDDAAAKAQTGAADAGCSHFTPYPNGKKLNLSVAKKRVTEKAIEMIGNNGILSFDTSSPECRAFLAVLDKHQALRDKHNAQCSADD